MRIALASIRYSPNQLQHMEAFCSMFEKMGHETYLVLAQKYQIHYKGSERIIIGKGIEEVVNLGFDIIISYNIGSENISLAKRCRKKNIRFYYVLHDPWMGLTGLVKEGKKALRICAAAIVNAVICRNSYCVLLPSQAGVNYYKRAHIVYRAPYQFFPLIMKDKYNETNNIKREYFSFIGGFIPAHGTEDFISFIEFAIENNLKVKFLIATKDDVSHIRKRPCIKKALKKEILYIHDGRYMTTEEINGYYLQSICVWNAYTRSTQSGVLPSSLMMGTPVIANENGISKYVIENKKSGCLIGYPTNNSELYSAFRYLEKNIDTASKEARQAFISNYYYKNFCNTAKAIFEDDKLIVKEG